MLLYNVTDWNRTINGISILNMNVIVECEDFSDEFKERPDQNFKIEDFMGKGTMPPAGSHGWWSESSTAFHLE